MIFFRSLWTTLYKKINLTSTLETAASASLERAVKLVLADDIVFTDEAEGGGGLGVRIDADLGRSKLGLVLANDLKKPFEAI